MRPAPRPRWQQATALVSLGAGGAVTGVSFVPGSPADLTSPATLPVALMALEKSAQSTQSAPSDDAMLRSAIVHVAKHFLRMAERNSPAEMEALIWRHASLDGADHGPSCAAFASLTLELGSHVAGQQSWVTGGTTYPWPLHPWADARVDPNPASPAVLSVLQDAQNHHRWHPLGDGYQPQPGDWVLFDGHVEVVANYAGGVLDTIGGDSLPNYSVNAHSYSGPLSGQGVAGFVDNGLQPTAAAPSSGPVAGPAAHNGQTRKPQHAQAAAKPRAKPAAPAAAAPDRGSASNGSAAPETPFEVLAPRAIPAPPAAPESPFVRSRSLAETGAKTPNAGTLAETGAKTPKAGTFQPTAPQARPQATAQTAPRVRQPRRDPGRQHASAGGAGEPANLVHGRKSGKADIPATGLRPPATPRARLGQAEIPGLLKRAPRVAAPPGGLAPYQRHQYVPSAPPATSGSAVERAFIEQVAPGAMATQQKYGIPASVTIAQAIDESGWGQSILATQDHNLFGIKGTGPGGSDLLPTQEYSGGQLVDTTAPFRIYYDIGQSIEAHGKLLARSDYFTNAMANRNQPNAFADALTGVYATDPSYGAKLVGLMQQYDLYRFDVAAHAHGSPRAGSGEAAIPGISGHGRPTSSRAAPPASGRPAAAHAEPAPVRGGTAKAGPASPAGLDPRRGRAPRPAGHRGRGDHGGAAGGAGHGGSADAGWQPDSEIPGTTQAGPPTGRPRADARRTASAGQAEIPGLPSLAAAPVPDPGHRTRIVSRLRPAHPPASGHSPSRRQPGGAGPAAGGHQGNPPSSTPGAATPHPSRRNGRGRPASVRQPGSADVTIIPGPTDPAYQHAAEEPASATMASLGDVAIPGLPLASPAGMTNGSDVVGQDGAWIPGVPGPGSGTATHDGHRIGPARRGSAATGAAHGTDLAPTSARRFASRGRPSAAPGHGAASAHHAPRPGSSAVPAPVPLASPGSASAGGRAAGHGHAARAHRSAHPPTANAAPAAVTATATPPPGTSAIPGLPDGGPAANGAATARPASAGSRSGAAGPAPAPSAAAGPQPAPGADVSGPAQGAPAPAPAPSPASGAGTAFGAGEPIPATTTAVTAVRYSHHLPPAIGKAYVTSAKVPLIRGAPLYADVAGQSGIPWEILAACDWMQCKAKPGLSPVYGERLGTVNPDGTSYRTRSSALERCAYDLMELARSVYQIDLTRGDPLSVRDLANVFAAYRWGGLLREHHTSAMEFPYSVAGLTTQHMHMRWPNIDDPQAPDKPGARFHKPFGAVPVVLSLSYPAVA